LLLPFPTRRPTALLQLGSAALLVVAIASGWWASTRQGGDFIYPYMLSHSLLYGEPIYDRDWQLESLPAITGQERPGEGFFYPAGTGFATLPFVAFSYRKAQLLWLAVLIAVVVLGTASFLRVWREGDKNLPWMAAAGLVLLSASIRWGMTPLQGAPLVMGLLCLFVVSIKKGNYFAASAITTFVLVLKFTVAIPFLAFLLLLGKWRETAGAGAIAALAHMVAFARVGGLAAFSAYAQGVAGLEALGSINTPDPWDVMSSPRADWTYLYKGLIGDPQIGKRLSLATTVLVAIWLLWLGWRLRDRLEGQVTATFLLAVTCFGLLCVYHHHYDVSAALVPLMMLGILHLGGNKLPPSFLLLTAPLVAIVALLPVALMQRLLASLGGPSAVGYMNIFFPASITLALLAGCLHLTRLQSHPQQIAGC
jgi:Glycosyltransferase family 87